MKNVKHLGLIGLMTLGLGAHAKTDVAAGLSQLKANETNAKANQKQYDENGEIASKNIVEVTAAIKTLRDQKTTLNSNAANLEKNRAVLTKMEERLNAFTKDEEAQMKKEAAQIAQLKATLEKLEANQAQRTKNLEVYSQKIAEVQKERADWESQKQAFAQIQKELETKEGKALAEREKWIEKRKGYRGEASKWEKESKIAEEHRVKFDRLAK